MYYCHICFRTPTHVVGESGDTSLYPRFSLHLMIMGDKNNNNGNLHFNAYICNIVLKWIKLITPIFTQNPRLQRRFPYLLQIIWFILGIFHNPSPPLYYWIRLYCFLHVWLHVSFWKCRGKFLGRIYLHSNYKLGE